MIAEAPGLVDRLVLALRAEEGARAAVRDALAEQAKLLRELRAAGLPVTRVAHRIALARGAALPIQERQRFAERLRKRAWRGTGRPADLAGPHGQPSAADPRSDRAITPLQTETPMGKLIKRTVVEEFVEDEDRDEEDELEPGDEGDDDNAEEDEPASTRTRRRRK